MFFGREDIFGWIERSLTGKFVNHILVLHGQRRVGKTSVLKQIPRHLTKHYVQVFFDLQGRTNTTLDRFLWWMASEITRTLKKECNLELQKIDRNAFADPEAFINDFLPSLHALIGDKVLLLTFDEFDTRAHLDIPELVKHGLLIENRQEGLYHILSPSFERWIAKEILVAPGEEESQTTVKEWLKSGEKENLEPVIGLMPKFKKKYWPVIANFSKEISMELIGGIAFEILTKGLI